MSKTFILDTEEAETLLVRKWNNSTENHIKQKKCWFDKMGSHDDLAITQPILRLGLKIITFLKSELNGLFKNAQYCSSTHFLS